MRSKNLTPAALALAVLLCSSSEIRAETWTVTLLYTNDIESVYEPVEAFWNPDIERIGGIPYLSRS